MRGARKPRRVIAIDFDGVLANAELGLIPRGKELAQMAFDAGHFLVVYTARPWDDLELVRAFCVQHGVRFDCIECGKLRFDILIDDRVYRPEEKETWL